MQEPNNLESLSLQEPNRHSPKPARTQPSRYHHEVLHSTCNCHGQIVASVSMHPSAAFWNFTPNYSLVQLKQPKTKWRSLFLLLLFPPPQPPSLSPLFFFDLNYVSFVRGNEIIHEAKLSRQIKFLKANSDNDEN